MKKWIISVFAALALSGVAAAQSPLITAQTPYKGFEIKSTWDTTFGDTLAARQAVYANPHPSSAAWITDIRNRTGVLHANIGDYSTTFCFATNSDPLVTLKYRLYTDPITFSDGPGIPQWDRWNAAGWVTLRIPTSCQNSTGGMFRFNPDDSVVIVNLDDPSYVWEFNGYARVGSDVGTAYMTRWSRLASATSWEGSHKGVGSMRTMATQNPTEPTETNLPGGMQTTACFASADLTQSRVMKADLDIAISTGGVLPHAVSMVHPYDVNLNAAVQSYPCKPPGDWNPHGARMQLNPDLNVEALSVSAAWKAVLRTMQVHGAISTDFAPDMSIHFEFRQATSGAGIWTGYGLTDSIGGATYATIFDNLRLIPCEAAEAWPGECTGTPPDLTEPPPPDPSDPGGPITFGTPAIYRTTTGTALNPIDVSFTVDADAKAIVAVNQRVGSLTGQLQSVAVVGQTQVACTNRADVGVSGNFNATSIFTCVPAPTAGTYTARFTFDQVREGTVAILPLYGAVDTATVARSAAVKTDATGGGVAQSASVQLSTVEGDLVVLSANLGMFEPDAYRVSSTAPLGSETEHYDVDNDPSGANWRAGLYTLLAPVGTSTTIGANWTAGSTGNTPYSLAAVAIAATPADDPGPTLTYSFETVTLPGNAVVAATLTPLVVQIRRSDGTLEVIAGLQCLVDIRDPNDISTSLGILSGTLAQVTDASGQCSWSDLAVSAAGTYSLFVYTLDSDGILLTPPNPLLTAPITISASSGTISDVTIFPGIRVFSPQTVTLEAAMVGVAGEVIIQWRQSAASPWRTVVAGLTSSSFPYLMNNPPFRGGNALRVRVCTADLMTCAESATFAFAPPFTGFAP